MSPPQRYLIVVFIAAAALYLIGNDRVGLWDRDEPRYAQTSKQMLRSHPPDWVIPRLLDDVRTAKPIFIYWCQAGAMWLLNSTDPFAARLPSVVAMVITLIVLGIAIGKSIGWWRAFWTVFILSTSGLVIAAAKMCITDSVLLLWITIAQLCLFAVYQGNRSWLVTVTLWLSIGIALLTKGPVVLGIQLTTMIALAAMDVGQEWRSGRAWLNAIRWWARTRPLVGILLAAAVVTPWLIQVQHREPTFLRRAFWHDVVARSMKPLEGHAGPPGYYLLTVWGTFFPWCIFLVAALPWAWRNRRLAPLRFALAAVIGPWILMEIVKTKLAHYVLPAFPPLAFITADMLFRAIRGQISDLRRPAFIGLVAIWAIIVAAIGAAPWLAMRRFDSLPTMAMIILTIAGIIYGASVFILFARRRIASAATTMGAGIIAVIAIFYMLYLPNAQFLWLPERIASVLLENGATRPGDVINLDYREDSLAYYQGGTIRTKENTYFTDTSRDRWAQWIVLTSDLWQKLPPDVRSRYEPTATLRGLAYAKRGAIVDVMVIRRIDTRQ
jgi:4-amino-4-deoxy-L-arabinose transferase-like glycosyltransferase